MSRPEPYPYQSLDATRLEIRVIRFGPHDLKYPGLVQCWLEHVSLDNITAEYADFMETNRDFPVEQTREIWFQRENTVISKETTSIGGAQQVIVMEGWRSAAELAPQPELLNMMGIDTSKLPEMPDNIRTVYVGGPQELKPESHISTPERPRYTALKPRFEWGDYEALSYCWESDERNKTMILNGRVTAVPTNLEAMLQKIQCLPEARSGLAFWVDGLCINQDSTTEKNHQVRLMKDIFQQAYATIVWLGPGSESTEYAMDFLVQLADIHGRIQGAKVRPNIAAWFGLQAPPASDWVRVVLLLRAPYFRRMWIIQELALNSTKTMLVCGTRHVSRHTLVAACKLLMQYSLWIGKIIYRPTESHGEHSDWLQGGPGPDEQETFESTGAARGMWELASGLHNLLSLRRENINIDSALYMARKANVTDDRDRIYGLLGLLPAEIARVIVPDYSQSNPPAAVYLQFAQARLSKCVNLDEVLSWCSFDAERAQPSWVADWSAPFERYHMRWFRRLQASGGAPASHALSADGMKLSCVWMMLDTITALTVTSSGNIPYRAIFDAKISRNFGRVHLGRYRDMRRLKQALGRTLLHRHPRARNNGDLTHIYWIDWDIVKNADDDDHQLEAFWGFHNSMFSDDNDNWTYFDRFRHTNAQFSIFGHRLKDMFPNMRDHEVTWIGKAGDYGDETDDYKQSPYELTDAHRTNMILAAVALRGRRLVTTNDGYLGLVPDAAQAGDLIGILLGCNYPVVLRPCEGGYKYIGECYMDVDTRDMLSDNPQKDTIVLC